MDITDEPRPRREHMANPIDKVDSDIATMAFIKDYGTDPVPGDRIFHGGHLLLRVAGNRWVDAPAGMTTGFKR